MESDNVVCLELPTLSSLKTPTCFGISWAQAFDFVDTSPYGTTWGIDNNITFDPGAADPRHWCVQSNVNEAFEKV